MITVMIISISRTSVTIISITTISISSSTLPSQDPHGSAPDARRIRKSGYSLQGGAIGGGCSGWGQYYRTKQPIIECKPLHPDIYIYIYIYIYVCSTAPPL